MMSRGLALAVVFVLVFAAAVCSARAQWSGADLQAAAAVLDAAKLSIEDATITAAALDPEGLVIGVETRVDAGQNCWAVSLLGKDELRTMLLDAATGSERRVERRRLPSDAANIRGLIPQGTIGHVEACRIATEALPGARVFAVRTTAPGSVIVYEVRLLLGRDPKWAQIDASGGVIFAGDPPKTKPKR